LLSSISRQGRLILSRRKSVSPIPEAIVQLQHQLEQFRDSHAHRTRLPESLWQAAVELARQHGLYTLALLPGSRTSCSAVPESSVITLKPATYGQFKTGHFGWPRRDCFTLRRGAFARRDSSRCSYGRFSSRSGAW
jgi:hypothetical protein